MRLSRLARATLLAVGVVSAASASNGYFRHPTVHGNQLVFTAEGDLWTASITGGEAHRLTSHESEESRSHLSPDGKLIAFVASYEGTQEAWVMPAAGGQPRRLTFEGGAVHVLGWTPKGEVLYSAFNSVGPNNQRVISTVHPDTLARRTFPLADVTDAEMSDDGNTLFVVRHGPTVRNDNLKLYRGGLAAEIWRFDVNGKSEAVKLAFNFPAKRPMVWQGRLYFVTDKDGTDNVWSSTFDGSDLRQETRNSGWDMRGVSLDQGHIVYQLGADIHVFDLASGKDSVPDIHLSSDFRQQAERTIRNPLNWLESVDLAASGNRVALVARGQIALAGQNQLRRIDIATPAGSRSRLATISHNGKWVYAINDANGEQQIWRFPADGSQGGKALTSDQAGYRTTLVESPDGKWIVHGNKFGKLWLLDIASGKNTLLDESISGDYSNIVFSPDSKTLALSRTGATGQRNQIVLVEMSSGGKHMVTTEKYDSHDPAFSPDGKWLYFLSDRNFEASIAGPWGDRNMGPFFDKRTKVYALALQDGLRFPFQPKDELEVSQGDKAADSKDHDKKSADKDKSGEGDKAKPDSKALPAIVWNGLNGRLFEVPLAAGNYRGLDLDDKRLYILEASGQGKHVLKTLPIEATSPQALVFANDVREAVLSSDKKKVMIRKQNNDLLIADAGAKLPDDVSKLAVRTGDWNVTLQPRAEWNQMFADAWRMHRDFLFDPNMRGADWKTVRAKYEALLPRVNDRLELEDLIAQMNSEVSTLHSQMRPGDVRNAGDGSTPAFLGATVEKVTDGYKVTHIYRGDPELPDEASPLLKPGVDIREGDVITAINGKLTIEARDLSDLLRNQAGQQILIDFKRGQDARRAIIIAANAMTNSGLRYGDWEESLRRKVDEASKGRIGYLHLRAMGGNDIANFAREFYANINRDGLIIDVRRNNGGNIDSWIIEKLLRRAWAFWRPRDGSPDFKYTNMQQTFRGHLVVLIDEQSYSDGEAFAAGIKELGIAPLIGKRTAGAGVWLSDGNRLVDGGQARAAENGVFSVKTGELMVEGIGVEPDILVENPPRHTFEGGDKQLEAAIQWLQDKLTREPIKPLVQGAIPPVGKSVK
ncbi:PDZ domain-containing protein [Burkholderiaceae bacterium DAT-1]|nr:PDZ domain-containing protein [Burkholderiaceae bacterium DAT-1]